MAKTSQTLKEGDLVKLASNPNGKFAERYAGRFGWIDSIETKGRSTRFHVEMPQKATPLVLNQRQFTLAEAV